MKKVRFIKTIKIVFTLLFAVGGLVLLTYFRLCGIHIFGLDISSEQVNMFVDSAGTKVYAVWISFTVLLFYGFWISHWIFKKRDKDK